MKIVVVLMEGTLWIIGNFIVLSIDLFIATIKSFLITVSVKKPLSCLMANYSNNGACSHITV